MCQSRRFNNKDANQLRCEVFQDDNNNGKGIKIGDTTISFGGFIKADVIFGSNGNGISNGYSIGLPRTLAKAANEGESDWKTGFSVRESRISIGTKTEDVAGHDLTTYIEMDFNTAAVHIPAHRDHPFRLNVTACSG